MDINLDADLVTHASGILQFQGSSSERRKTHLRQYFLDPQEDALSGDCDNVVGDA